MYCILLAVCLVGLSVSQTTPPPTPPPKCCSDREYEAIIGEVGGAMYHVHGHYVNNFIQGYTVLHYDSYNEKIAMENTMTFNQTTFKSRIVMDYTQKQQYLVLENGTCYSYTFNQVFRSACVPDYATFDGYSHMGYGVHQLPLVNWRYRQPGTDHIVKIARTAAGCIPVIEARFGHYNNSAIAGETITSNVLLVLNAFKPSIRDRAVFNIPTNCNHISGQLPIPQVRRAQRALSL